MKLICTRGFASLVYLPRSRGLGSKARCYLVRLIQCFPRELAWFLSDIPFRGTRASAAGAQRINLHSAQTSTMCPGLTRHGRVLAQYADAFGRGAPTHMCGAPAQGSRCCLTVLTFDPQARPARRGLSQTLTRQIPFAYIFYSRVCSHRSRAQLITP
jgi:hypothetical protein